MTEIIFYPILISKKNKLVNLEKIEDKSDNNLRKIFNPCKCKKNECSNYCRFKMRLKVGADDNIYENQKNKLIISINDFSEQEQKKQNILTNLITEDFNNNLVLNLYGFDSDDIEKIKPYIIKKIKENFGNIYSLNCNYTRIKNETLIDILDLIDTKALKYLTINHYCNLNKSLLFEKLIEKKFNLDSLDLDTSGFSLIEENFKNLSNLVKNNILNPNSLRIGSSKGLIKYKDVYCFDKLLQLINICGNRLDRDRILPDDYRHKEFAPKNDEEIALKNKCENILYR